ncbi:MAG: hypothetical protein AAGB15_01425 [Pseudomonadota bacterium]
MSNEPQKDPKGKLTCLKACYGALAVLAAGGCLGLDGTALKALAGVAYLVLAIRG